jgi:nicotinamidase-related amidase
MATALFVIDIQNDLATDPETRIPHADRVKAAGGKILGAARAALGAEPGTSPGALASIIFVQHEEKPEDGPLVRGSEPWKLVFEPRAGVSRERLVPKWTRELECT